MRLLVQHLIHFAASIDRTALKLQEEEKTANQDHCYLIEIKNSSKEFCEMYVNR